MTDVILTQHPVGQGGMMSGRLSVSRGQYHWIYDCGSNQISALNREIDLVVAAGPVDCLFLSHLDSDHVNGIDRLLSRIQVREVVLPYLENVDRLIAVAHDAAAGTMTGTFLTFLRDIRGWFGERGVTRITYIDPRSDEDDEGGGGPERRRYDEGSGEGEITREWSSPGGKMQLESLSYGEQNQIQQTAQRLGAGANLQLTAAGRLNWFLLPYAHRPSSGALAVFEAALEATFPAYRRDLQFDLTNFLLDILRDSQKRDQLRDCYDLIWADHNLVSMALYAGPLQADPLRPGQWTGCCVNRSSRHWHWYCQDHPMDAVGWLGTGDMHLNVRRRRDAFLFHYRTVLDQVNVFGLPHHGSLLNFDSSLPSKMRQAKQCVAAAGPNSYGHPAKDVERAVAANGKAFVQVSDKAGSVLEWRHRF